MTCTTQLEVSSFECMAHVTLGLLVAIAQHCPLIRSAHLQGMGASFWDDPHWPTSNTLTSPHPHLKALTQLRLSSVGSSGPGDDLARRRLLQGLVQLVASSPLSSLQLDLECDLFDVGALAVLTQLHTLRVSPTLKGRIGGRWVRLQQLMQPYVVGSTLRASDGDVEWLRTTPTGGGREEDMEWEMVGDDIPLAPRFIQQPRFGGRSGREAFFDSIQRSDAS